MFRLGLRLNFGSLHSLCRLRLGRDAVLIGNCAFTSPFLKAFSKTHSVYRSFAFVLLFRSMIFCGRVFRVLFRARVFLTNATITTNLGLRSHIAIFLSDDLYT